MGCPVIGGILSVADNVSNNYPFRGVNISKYLCCSAEEFKCIKIIFIGISKKYKFLPK